VSWEKVFYPIVEKPGQNDFPFESLWQRKGNGFKRRYSGSEKTGFDSTICYPMVLFRCWVSFLCLNF